MQIWGRPRRVGIRFVVWREEGRVYVDCQVVVISMDGIKDDLRDTCILVILFQVLLQTKSNLPFTSAIPYRPESTRRMLKSRGKPVSVSIWILNKRVACFSSISTRMVWCGVMN